MEKCPNEECHNNVQEVRKTLYDDETGLKERVIQMETKKADAEEVQEIKDTFWKRPSTSVIMGLAAILLIPLFTTGMNIYTQQKINMSEFAKKADVIELKGETALLQQSCSTITKNVDEIKDTVALQKTEARVDRKELKTDMEKKVDEIKDLIKAMHK